MLDDIITDVRAMSSDLSEVTKNIIIPKVEDISLDVSCNNGMAHRLPSSQGELGRGSGRSSWDKVNKARCDFSPHLSMRTRAGFTFVSLWQKTVYGRTLVEIKSDDGMVKFFAEAIAPLITDVLGDHLRSGGWSIVTTPMRRHKEHNFASMIAKEIADKLDVPFYFDCAHCKSAHRVGAVFTANNIPKEQNVIVFDDFITTGSTLKSMRDLLVSHDKNCFVIAGINVHM